MVRVWVACVGVALQLSVAGFALAQDAVPPPPVFDPSNPLAGPLNDPVPAMPPVPDTLVPDPIKPAAIPEVGDLPPLPGGDNATLPALQSDDELEFFQGYRNRDDDDDGDKGPPEEVVEIKPEPKKQARAPLPLVRFNYKNQYLPRTIYQKDYNAENRHLPIARYERDYDNATFMAVMRNDVNQLRAMMNQGRDLEMRNAAGESLVQVAVRYRAHSALRYLLAKGAAPHSAPAQPDTLSHYALQAAGGR